MILSREMRKADVGQVHEVECACFITPWSEKSLLSELRNSIAHYIVLEDGNTIVGYGGMWVLFEEAHVTNIAVMKDYRRQGLAKGMMLELMQKAMAKGATCMTLEVRESNLGAQALYRLLDFEQQGYRKRYYQDTGEGALLMWNMNIAKTVAKFSQI